VPVLGRPLTLALAFAGVLTGGVSVAEAQQATSPDAGVTPSGEAPAPRPVRWHGSTLVLNQRVGTQTVGVGSDYQSRNPFYDIGVYFRPRYYLWERAPSSLSLRAQFTGTYEATNSDSTTKRGEVLLEDTTLSLVPEHTFGPAEQKTLVSVSVPRLTLPTSLASRRSGKIVEAGVRVFVDHSVPFRENSKVLPRGRIAARLGYAYQFVTGSVPSSDTVNRLRKDLDGHTAKNGQLGGAAFADHSGVLRGIIGAELYADLLSFEFELGIDPAHKRKLPRPLVTDLPLGPYDARSVADPQQRGAVTYLDTSITLSIEDMLQLALGYENVATQIGDDGERRTPFYSPDAKFYLAAELTLDKVYERVRGPSPSKKVAVVR
jgi:hypothetical protein